MLNVSCVTPTSWTVFQMSTKLEHSSVELLAATLAPVLLLLLLLPLSLPAVVVPVARPASDKAAAQLLCCWDAAAGGSVSIGTSADRGLEIGWQVVGVCVMLLRCQFACEYNDVRASWGSCMCGVFVPIEGGSGMKKFVVPHMNRDRFASKCGMK